MIYKLRPAEEMRKITDECASDPKNDFITTCYRMIAKGIYEASNKGYDSLAYNFIVDKFNKTDRRYIGETIIKHLKELGYEATYKLKSVNDFLQVEISW